MASWHHYIKIGDIASAAPILRHLVNENYNTVMNAQLLSRIYVHNVIENDSTESRANYHMLSSRVDSMYLFPLLTEDEGGDSENAQVKEQRPAKVEEHLNTLFVKKQEEVLYDKYGLVLKRFFRKYSIAFNRIIPIPLEPNEKDDDELYTNDPSAVSDRYNRVENALNGEKESRAYRASKTL